MNAFYPPGRYRLKTVGAALGESQTGTPQIELGIEVVGYYDAADNSFHPMTGPERTVYLSLTDGTLGTPHNPGWVYQQLIDLGWAGRSFDDLAAIVGQVRDGECRHESFDGKTQEKWGLYRRRGSTAQRPIQDRTRRQLNQRFAALLRRPSAPVTGPDARRAVAEVLSEAARNGEPGASATGVRGEPGASATGVRGVSPPSRDDDEIPF